MRFLFTALFFVCAVFSFSANALSAQPLYFYDTKGEKMLLSTFKDKPTIVFVYKRDCGICLNMLTELDKFKQTLESEFNVLPVMIGDTSTSTARKLFIKLDIRNLPIYLDKDNVLPTELGFHVTPMTILFNTDGKTVKKIVGKLNWKGPFFAEELRELKSLALTVPENTKKEKDMENDKLL